MIDNRYRNSFKEVYEILQNTEAELLEKIPSSFIDFLKNNMNNDYQTNIKTNIDVDKQPILPETEDILSLIFRSYWAIDEEKQELLQLDESKQINYKDINEIFDEKKKLKHITLDNNLMVIPKENFIQKLLKKLLSIFRK